MVVHRKLGKGEHMNREEILAMSRKENEGKSDERELQIFSDASRVGMAVGAFVAFLTIIFSRIIDVPILGLSAWSVYFLMYGSRHLVYFIKTKEKDRLVPALIGLVFGTACVVGMIVLGLM